MPIPMTIGSNPASRNFGITGAEVGIAPIDVEPIAMCSPQLLG